MDDVRASWDRSARRGTALLLTVLLVGGAGACGLPPVTLTRQLNTVPSFSPRSLPLVIVRGRHADPAPAWLPRWLGGGGSDRSYQVEGVFRAAGYRTLTAPLQGDTLGLGDDNLASGHERLALDLTLAPLGGAAPPPGLPNLRATLARNAVDIGAAWLAICDFTMLEKAWTRSEHWECSVFDVATGALVYAGAGEITSDWQRDGNRQALERALAGLLGTPAVTR